MPQLYSRVFVQILDSSLAEDYVARHVFEDFLKLTEDGLVDMTREAIARRTNIPLKVINAAIAKLEGPDPASRDPDEDGKRIIRLDTHRDWGWRIVNWEKYERVKSKEQERMKTRERVARHRQKRSSPPPAPPPKTPEADSTSDSDSDSEQALQKRYAPLQTVTSSTSDCPSEAHTDYKRRGIPRSEKEAIEMGVVRGASEQVAKDFYNHYEAVGWIDGNGHPIVNAGAKFNAWIASAREKQHQSKSQGSSATRSLSVHEMRVILEAKQAEAKELKGRSCGEVPMGSIWTCDYDKQKYLKLTTEIRELRSKIGAMA